MMKAKVRLYLTASKTALVHEGDPQAATLYAAPGDVIPDTAAERFGLVDGTLGDGPDWLSAGDSEAILRVAAVDTGPFGRVTAAGFEFGVHEFRSGDIDEGQLLAILKQPGLSVETALVGDPSPGFVPFPGREAAISALQAHIDYDIAHGRPHDRVVDRQDLRVVPHPVDTAPPPPPPPPPPAVSEKPVKARKGGAKEAAPAANKEAAPADDKGATANRESEA
jgi:hypothetical protein